MRALVASLLAFLPVAALAAPPVAVKSVLLQKGVYRTACDVDLAPEFCQCRAEIRYPRLATDAGDLRRLNEDLRADAAAAKCPGEKIHDSKEARAEQRYSFKTIYDAPGAMTLSLLNYTMPAGAAHGMYSTEYVVIDKQAGKRMEYRDLIDTAKLDDLNGYVHGALKANPETFLANGNPNLSASKGDVNYEYLTATACEECSIGVDERGLFLLFSLYSEAPYAAGEIRVDVPDEFVAPGALTLISKKDR